MLVAHVRQMCLLLAACMSRSKNTLKFTMNKDTSCEATADVTVYDVSSKFRLAVVEVRKLRCAAPHCIVRTPTALRACDQRCCAP